ncbi:hypothetical protein AC578_4270 [Pseudocercospora eumusae]|uniref:Uncharacterized protein n=1 Tax=Pseudocercospora eumusae TaxID=321146 RepID=A0A139HAS5_9PEZI|nr:hypothetical protein AC578_4270 [Pseudocercospora eumusae]
MNDHVVILLCLLGAGAALLLGYAIFRYFMPSAGRNDIERPGPDGMTQVQYMRTVRLRNHEQLQAMYAPRQPRRTMYTHEEYNHRTSDATSDFY